DHWWRQSWCCQTFLVLCKRFDVLHRNSSALRSYIGVIQAIKGAVLFLIQFASVLEPHFWRTTTTPASSQGRSNVASVRPLLWGESMSGMTAQVNHGR